MLMSELRAARCLALGMALVVGLAGPLTVLAAPPPPVGYLAVSAGVTINDKKALTGATIFSESLVSVDCTQGNSAVIHLGQLGTIELGAGARLLLRFGEGLVGGDLLEGQIRVRTPSGVRIAITTPGGPVVSDGQKPALLPIRSGKGALCVPLPYTSRTDGPAASGGTAVTPSLSTASLVALALGVSGIIIVGAIAAANNQVSPTTP